MKKNFLLVLMGFLLATTFSFAEEANLTNQERAEQRDAVVTGVVNSLQEVVGLAEGEVMMMATVTVEKVAKANGLAAADKLQIYFLKNETKKDNVKYVSLKVGQKADFYLDVRDLFANKKTLFLDSSADVRKPNTSDAKY